MRQDLAIRAEVRDKLKVLAEEMSSWEEVPRIDEEEEQRIEAAVHSYKHTTKREELIICGVDGTGDFPALSYGDSFVYVTLAQGTRYEAHPISGLKEVAPEMDPVIEFTWLPEDDEKARKVYNTAFGALASSSIEDIITRSDYRAMKKAGLSTSVEELASTLIRPHATDSGNVAIQLRSTAELGAALRMIESEPRPNYVLLDSTFSLPFVNKDRISLFFEHVKRLCCVEALKRGIGFFALSKSHGLPGMERLEQLAAKALGIEETQKPEHWFFRLPIESRDGWTFSLAENRKVPPVGAISYLVRFHKNTPIMRLDMDVNYWDQFICDKDPVVMLANEKRLFEDLDYASHDQRAYGYPYPIKAGHDRASLTNAERKVLRKMIIDAAIAAGMRPQLFRNVAQSTGHG